MHRLNTEAEYGPEAVDVGAADVYAQVRRDFVRNCPDLVQFQIALRTELLMKIVMPALVPNSEAERFLSMARFECGKNGNPHYHGFCVGAGNPRLGRVRNDVGDGGWGDLEVAEASGSESEEAGTGAETKQ